VVFERRIHQCPNVIVVFSIERKSIPIRTRQISLYQGKIPRPTIVSWRTTEWWKELEKDLRAEENIVLSSTMKGLVDKSLLAVEDRLDNGDWIYDNKQGKAVRKPVSMKDALSVSTNLIDKRIAIASTESYTVANDSIAEKLAKLAKSFEEFASAKPTVNVTDVIFVEEKKEP
jgi:hypothetical protein